MQLTGWRPTFVAENLSSMKFYTAIIKLLVNYFGLEADSTEAEVHDKLSSAGTLADMRAEIKAEFEEQIKTQEGQIKDLSDKLEAAQQEEKRLVGMVTQLTAEVEELKKNPAEEHTKGEKEAAPSKTDEKPWLKDPINQRAKRLKGA